MTVNYQLDVSSGNPILFLKLLSRWRGSIWKSVAWELIGWLLLFYITYFLYRFAFTTGMQSVFEMVSVHIEDRMSYLPLTFMLGFFVTTVFERWRSALNVMPFIESLALSTAVLVPGKGEEDRLVRRSIIRYIVLHQVLIFRDISMRVRRRFPTMQCVVDAGFMTDEELSIFESTNCNPGQKYWIPVNWANSIVLKAFQKKLIEQPLPFNTLILAIKEFRVSMETLIKFDQMPIPIAYPQVVFLAVRVYFLLCIIGRQFLVSDLKSKTQMDYPVPIMTILEFIFVIGWMKVAEVLLNPLGEDDDDFEINWIIDKNIATGMAIVDDTHVYHPVLINDKFADPNYLPQYSEQSQVPRTMNGSAAKVELAGPEDEVKMVAVVPNDAPPTSERGSIFKRNPLSVKQSQRKLSTPNVESPLKDKKFNLPISTTSIAKSKQTDRPVLETLNEEIEGKQKDYRIHSTESFNKCSSSEDNDKKK